MSSESLKQKRARQASYPVVCPYNRVVQYRILRVEYLLFIKTKEALQTWTSAMLMQTTESEQLYYSTLGKLASVNNRCLIRMNEIRKRLKLPDYVDETTYSIKLPVDPV